MLKILNFFYPSFFSYVQIPQIYCSTFCSWPQIAGNLAKSQFVPSNLRLYIYARVKVPIISMKQTTSNNNTLHLINQQSLL